MLTNAGRLYPAQVVSQKNQKEQCNGKPNAEGKGFDGPVALPLIAHQKEESGAQTAQDENKSNSNENFHNSGQSGAFKRTAPCVIADDE